MKNSQDTEKQEEMPGEKKYVIYEKHNNKAKTEHLIPQRRGGGGTSYFAQKETCHLFCYPV